MSELRNEWHGDDVAPGKSLDQQYVMLNRLYIDRNFYRDEFSIFGHLVEVVGGLSGLATRKSKPGVTTESFIPKALAWWMALCGQVRIGSVEELVWRKFPGRCSYCLRERCSGATCRLDKKEARERGDPVPDWKKLSDLGSTAEAISSKPSSLGDWVVMFSNIYEVGGTPNYESIFARFTEEIGEMSEALRALPVSPGYFLSEAADVFAWIVQLHLVYSVVEKDQNSVQAAAQLDEDFAEAYPGICKDCRGQVCVCPPILPSTLGRIAHEIPASELGDRDGPLSHDDAMKLFSSEPLRLGGMSVKLDTDLLMQVRSGVRQLVQHMIVDRTDDWGVNSALVEILLQMEDLAKTQRLTQATLDDLVEEWTQLEEPSRTGIIDFLKAANASLFAGLLIEIGKHAAT